MKFVLIGASGFVGTAILNEAINRGHEVTAVARNAGKIPSGKHGVKVVEADVFNRQQLTEVLNGHSLVVSAYNPGWTNPEIYNDFLKGATSIQEAAKAAGVPRYIVVGGAGSLFVAPGVQLIDTPEFPEAIKPGASAARDYLAQLANETELDWVFISPAIEMHQGTSGERKGTYRLGKDNPVFDENQRSILSVEDLAVAIVDEIETAAHHRERFTVAY